MDFNIESYDAPYLRTRVDGGLITRTYSRGLLVPRFSGQDWTRPYRRITGRQRTSVNAGDVPLGSADILSNIVLPDWHPLQTDMPALGPPLVDGKIDEKASNECALEEKVGIAHDEVTDAESEKMADETRDEISELRGLVEKYERHIREKMSDEIWKKIVGLRDKAEKCEQAIRYSEWRYDKLYSEKARLQDELVALRSAVEMYQRDARDTEEHRHKLCSDKVRLESELAAQRKITDAFMCVICVDQPCSILCLSCRNLSMCTKCADRVDACPKCRKPAKNMRLEIVLS